MSEPCTGGDRGIGQLGRVWNVKGGGWNSSGKSYGKDKRGGGFSWILKLESWCVVGVADATWSDV